ncbi:hypothetical protein MMC14_007506 [Varicellaria rhodocarpa]|nr:hypothetical protein [Varicellaria rhodocarpa]
MALPTARALLTLNALANSLGPYMADWSASHVFNPRWPPHAKFHNGQTMSTGLLLGLAMLYYTWRSPTEESLRVAALLGSIYWVSGMSAILYPGALALDPEFGTGFPQLPAFATFLGMSWVGYGLGVAGLGAGAGVGSKGF